MTDNTPLTGNGDSTGSDSPAADNQEMTAAQKLSSHILQALTVETPQEDLSVSDTPEEVETKVEIDATEKSAEALEDSTEKDSAEDAVVGAPTAGLSVSEEPVVSEEVEEPVVKSEPTDTPEPVSTLTVTTPTNGPTALELAVESLLAQSLKEEQARQEESSQVKQVEPETQEAQSIEFTDKPALSEENRNNSGEVSEDVELPQEKTQPEEDSWIDNSVVIPSIASRPVPETSQKPSEQTSSELPVELPEPPLAIQQDSQLDVPGVEDTALHDSATEPNLVAITPDATVREPQQPTAGVQTKPPAEDKPLAQPQKSTSPARWTWIMGVLSVLVVIALVVAYVLFGRSGAPVGRDSDSVIIPGGPLTPAYTNPENITLTAEWISNANQVDLGQWSGIVANALTGEILWEKDSDVLRTPASSTKLITGSAVTLGQDQDSRIATHLYRGLNPDELVLVGAGDVTLQRTPGGGFFTDAASLSDLSAAVDFPVKKIIIDNSWIGSTPIFNDNWSRQDIASGNVTQMTSIMLDAGRVDPLNPDSPRTDLPATEVGKVLAEQVGNSAAVVEISNSPVERGPELAMVESAPLHTRVDDMMVYSDNILAESLAWKLSEERGAGVGFANAPGESLQVMAEHGFDSGQTILTDNSGMSNANRVPAAFLNEIILAAEGAVPASANADVKDRLRALLDYLPVSGATGTLSERYKGPQSGSAAGWVRAKTGTLSDITALTGTVTTVAGELLTVALVSNDRPIMTARADSDVLMAQLRAFGTPAASEISTAQGLTLEGPPAADLPAPGPEDSDEAPTDNTNPIDPPLDTVPAPAS